MKTSITSMVALSVLFMSGCASKDQEAYYEAVKQQNANYMKSYDQVENESVQFDGEFKGKISIVKPKKLPQLQHIERPKSGSEVALDWARVVVPVAGMAVGMHYNYKTADSNNKYNSQNIESFTGNYQNTSSTTITDTSTVDTTVTDTSVSNTTLTDTSTSTSTVDTSTVNPTEYTDGTITISNP